MTGIKTIAIRKLTTQLENLGCKYMVITEGDETLSNDKGFEYHPPLKRGTLSTYVESFVQDMKPGDIAHVPYGEFPHKRVSNAVAAAGHKLFGKGNYVTQSRDEHVELLCLDIDTDLDQGE